MSTCGHIGQNASVAIKKEVTWGTYLTPDISLRASSAPLQKTITHTEDDSLVGERFTTDMILTMTGAGGTLDGKFHPDTAGLKLNWTLGGENAVANPPDSWLVINYTGTAFNYIRLTKSGSNLTAESSADGSAWVADTNFGTAGTYDLSAAPNDTTAELAALIDADTDYACTYFGLGTGITDNIADFAATNTRADSMKVGAIILNTPVTSTVAKLHDIFPADTSTCLPSYTIQENKTLGTDKSLAYVGSKVGSMGITLAAADLNSTSLTITSKDEEVDKTDVSLTIPSVASYTAKNTKILIDELEVTAVKDTSININNNLSNDTVIGSTTIEEQLAQKSSVDISGTVNLTNPTTDLYSKRSLYLNDTAAEVIIYMEGTDDADTDVKYSTLIRINRVKFTDFNVPVAGPDRLTIAIAGNATKPVSTYEHIEAYVVDKITATY